MDKQARSNGSSRRLTMTTIWAVVALGVAGCGSRNDTPTPGSACLLNSDCHNPLACSFGRCHTACREARDCPAGQRCVRAREGNVCQLPEEKSCAASACPTSLVCAADLQCRNRCTEDADCPTAQRCVGNVCAEPVELTPSGQLPVVQPLPDSGLPDAGPGADGSPMTSDAPLESKPDVVLPATGMPELIGGGAFREPRLVPDRFADPATPDYILNQSWEVESDLTFEAGVVVHARQGAGIWVKEQGSLAALGTADRKVVFRGQQDVRGFWPGLVFESASAKNALEHVQIAHAGHPWIGGTATSIWVRGLSRLRMREVAVTDGASHGLFLEHDTVMLDMKGGSFKRLGEAPVHALPQSFHMLDPSTDFAGNERRDYIQAPVFESRATVKGAPRVWQALNVPYLLAGNGLAIFETTVNIMPGTTILAGNHAGIYVSIQGALKAIGTAEKPIVFKAQQELPGYWRGFQFNSPSMENRFDFTEIAHGGSGGFYLPPALANIEVAGGGRLEITNSKIRDSKGVGIRVLGGGTLVQSGNTFSGNAEGDVVGN